MTAEVLTERAFTPKQLENQRLFGVGPGASMPEQPGDKGKRLRNKAIIFAAATAADLGESWAAEALLEKIHDRMVDKVDLQLNDPAAIRRNAIFSGIGFVEDMASDEAYSMGMNAILRKLTGLEEVSYASPTAKQIEGWTNLASFASGRFQNPVDEHHEVIEELKLKFWQKPWNFVNAINAEALVGLLEELPFGIGTSIKKGHARVDEKFRKSELLQLANGVAKAAVTGYHIERNMVHDSRPVVPTAE